MIDYTQGQVLYGVLKYYGNPKENIEIELVLEFNAQNNIRSRFITTKSNKFGEYWFGGMEYGEYRLYIHDLGEGYIIEFSIKLGEIKRLDLDLR